MLTIGRMTADYRVAGAGPDRALIAARLDRLVRTRLEVALEGVLGALDDEDGPVYRIRRLDVALWLDLGRFTEAAFARDWAETIARALYRQIAEGAPRDVVRYPSRADYLAAFLLDLIEGRAFSRWPYQEFHRLAGVPAGRAVAAALSDYPHAIGATFIALQRRRRLAPVLQTLTADDAAAVWLSWTGAVPAFGRPGPPALIALARAAMPQPPLLETGGKDARARNALRLLIALVAGPQGLRPEVAAPVAMQLAGLAALAFALPRLPRWAEIAALPPDARRRIAADVEASGGAAGPAAAWAAAVLGEAGGGEALARLAGLLDDTPAADGLEPGKPRAERRLSSAAGLALLLPAARSLQLAERFGREGLLQLLTLLAGPSHQALIEDDPAPVWFSGIPETARQTALDADLSWPAADELGVDPEGRERDAAYLGTRPQAPMARALLDRFAHGLRGMEGASAAYLARQFLVLEGTLIGDEKRLTVRIHRVPLEIVLRMAGRLGDQGPIPWLGARELTLEIGDG